MKIAIVSDLHLGYERFAEDAIDQAREALFKAYELADAVIIPGDVFDKRAPKPEVIAQAINLFRELSKMPWKSSVVSSVGDRGRFTSVPIIAISGTHERTAMGKDNALNLLGLAGLIVDTSESTTIIEKGDEKVAVFGLGGLSEERVKEQLLIMNPKPISGAFNIFMLHQSIYEILPFNESFIRFDDLPKGFDLYVDGHIHSMVEDKVHGMPFIIPGSTVLTQLKEGEQEPKGFVIFDTKARAYEFIKIKCRRMVFREIFFDDASPKALKDAIKLEIDQIISENKEMPIIKLRLIGKIAAGFSSIDMPIRPIISEYSNQCILDIDSSKLTSEEQDRQIDDIRAAHQGGNSIKEQGEIVLGQKLAEQGFDRKIDAFELFNILSSQGKKDSIIERAISILNSNN